MWHAAVAEDLKPENLLLDEHKRIKIVDFGLSNRFDDNQLLKTACGSHCYAPPEMLSRQSYVPQMCDLWSCGVTLFVMVCGSLPFEDTDGHTLSKKIVAGNYTPPAFITDTVKDLIAGLLTVDPAKRFTIADVRAHESYRQIPEASVRPRDLVSGQCGLEEDVLQELKCHGPDPTRFQKLS
ncbi:RKIN1 [Symbiodinium pilosum]|uniref:RKIN1 protein n=1 Tax=Symbiodinium pilosum TaxID=2952 RepID=A0A812TYE1_SYMPI|nr:RKIN1 [Symbiodinium pilosum]